MKCWTLAASVALTALGFGGAQADSVDLNSPPGYYISGVVGGSFLPDLRLSNIPGIHHDRFDDGFAAGGAIGYDTGTGWRYSLESLYQHSNVKGIDGAPAAGHLSSTSLMANATYDIIRGGEVTPYIGAGLGFQNIGGNVNGLTGRQWRPAYQLEAGLRTHLSPDVSLFGEYRFSQSQAARLSDAATTVHQHFSNNAILAGLSYSLD